MTTKKELNYWNRCLEEHNKIYHKGIPYVKGCHFGMGFVCAEHMKDELCR